MSFSALIDKLSTLVSKAYVFAGFIPVLVFAFVNGALLWFHSAVFHRWASEEVSHPSAFALASITVGLAVTAYMLVSLTTFLREVLEGKHLPFEALRLYLLSHQQRELDEAVTRYINARDNRLDISGSIPLWRDALSLAADEGIKTHPGTNSYSARDLVALRLKGMVRKFANAHTVNFAELNQLVEDFVNVLRTNDEGVKSQADPPAAESSRLQSDRFYFLELFDRVSASLVAEDRLLMERQFRFGFTAEPTALGNISSSVYAWAMMRYSMDISAFWSRLQPGLQADPNFYTVLQDAKVQVDFLVACCWLAALTWLGWIIALLFLSTTLGVWLGVAIGPLLAYFFYRLAVTSYSAFGDLMRTSVDLYRFSVLHAMHIPVPKGIREERRTWRTLQNITVFGEDDVELSYAQDAAKSSAS